MDMILNRFKEPSSWAALGTALFGGATQLPGWWGIASGVGSAVALALGVFLSEKK